MGGAGAEAPQRSGSSRLGGPAIASSKYLDDSGDTSVRLKQALRESPDHIFRMTGLIMKMARNLHEGFHELFPPTARPIEIYKERQQRLKGHR
jgi:hypothetical protein